ncbi:MAG: gliding motility-associated protein GldE [Petrimonas sp.]|nr:gliding motility-associated protein GldE [Petrimonas sp.]MEA4980728.1 gliding motility-associated protein GldE [Petrimonas sp.]
MDPDPLPFISSEVQAAALSVADYILIVLTLVLTYINAIISGSEIAFFSLSQEETEELNTDTRPGSVRVSKLLREPEKLLSAIVISYNSLNITIVTLLFYLLNLTPYFSGSDNKVILKLLIIIAFILLFVEFIPKTYASQRSLTFARNNSRFIQILNKLMAPFSSLLVRTSNIFSKSVIQKRYEISMDDLSKALEITSGEIKQEQEKDMLEGIIRFKDKTVDHILVSRSDMVAIDIATPFREVIRFIVEAGFSRIPVFEENPDNIKGILYVKDLLPHLIKTDNFRWQSLIRPAYFVPGTKRIDDLLEEFRANKNHMAIVVDEYGGTTGIVTMEDILEEIVGDISDEYDEEVKPFYTIAPDGSYIFEGKTSLEDFIEVTGVPERDFEKLQEDVDTIAGLMLELKGDFPKRKELVKYKRYGFQAEEMSKRRIMKVRFIPPKGDSE